MKSTVAEVVVWHDIECGAYRADLALWRALAARHGGPVLDLGAGTGRVALDLASRGVEVVALDVEPELLAELERRKGTRPVRTVPADARSFSLDRRFPLVIVPMQTVQLLLDPADRAALLRSVAAVLAPGGVFAAALADSLEPFDSAEADPPLPDVSERAGWLYVSQPVRIVVEDAAATIERERSVVSPTGERSTSVDRVRLARLDADALEAEGRAAGLRPIGRERVEATLDHVGSEVVILGG